jgi:integrase/recombinase XerD
VGQAFESWRTINEKGNVTFKDFENFSIGGDTRKNFIDWLRNEIEADNTVSIATLYARNNVLRRLIEVAGNFLPYSRVNYELIKQFNQKLSKDGLAPSTQVRLHSQLKKFITIATHEGIIKKNPYKLFKIKKPAQDLRNCLWYHDLDKIWELKYPDDSGKELARLKFLFSCYTGLRISDNTRLRWNDVRNGKLFVSMKKTVRPVIVPIDILGDRAGKILEIAKERYGSHDKVFKYIADQTVNDYLKNITIDAELPFPLTFHVARHTFCTMIAHETGSVFKVMEYAGIYKVDTAMIYVNLNRLYSS